MTPSAGAGAYTRVQFLDGAIDDLRVLKTRSPAALTAVLAKLKELDAGSVTPVPLRHFGKTGDLTDCGKIVVHVDDGTTYRIVVRNVDGTPEVYEVVVVENREADLPHLLAAIRLKRLEEDPVRRADATKRIWRIRKGLEPATDP